MINYKFFFKLITLLAFVYTLGLDAKNATACSCRPNNISDDFEKSDLVMIGEVLNLRTNKKQLKRGDKDFWFNDKTTATIQSLHILKGKKEQEFFEVGTEGETSACGYPFKRKVIYIIFAIKKDDGIYYTNACANNAMILDNK